MGDMLMGDTSPAKDKDQRFTQCSRGERLKGYSAGLNAEQVSDFLEVLIKSFNVQYVMFKTQEQYTNNKTINCPIFHPFEIICITDIISKK